MLKFRNILEEIGSRVISNEKLYNFCNLAEALEKDKDDFMEIDDVLITPYYVMDGKMMELYDFELNVDMSVDGTFEKYLWEITKKSVEEVAFDILNKRRNCYIRRENNSNFIKTSKLIAYINFLTENEELMGGVKVRCVTFDKSNLYFAYYGD